LKQSGKTVAVFQGKTCVTASKGSSVVLSST